MGRSFKYVILGGGVAAGYAAREFVEIGIQQGELCIISDEQYAPYERPALSKGFLVPEGASRLPAFHTCVAVKGDIQTPRWYRDHGIELLLNTQVTSVDTKMKTLMTTARETIGYATLIVATGARVIKLQEYAVAGADARNIFYLRNLNDATQLVEEMQRCKGGKAVVIGGGYIGMECAAALTSNDIHVTMVFPESHCIYRLFTPQIATFYEDYYTKKGVVFVKGANMSSFNNKDGKVVEVVLQDGSRLPADLVVVGIGIRANTSLFEDQLEFEDKGIKVNGKMRTSNKSVYAVGDVAAFPLKISGSKIRRLEHVDHARKSAAHAVRAILQPNQTTDYDYLPYFYSRVFTLSWQFFGDNTGKCVVFGDPRVEKFGAYWVDNGRLVGTFLEGGTENEYAALQMAARKRPVVEDTQLLAGQGIKFALALREKASSDSLVSTMVTESSSRLGLLEPYLDARVGVGIVTVTLGVTLAAYWYRRRKWRT